MSTVPGNPGNPAFVFTTEAGKKAFDAFINTPQRAVIMLDGDGTMWDVVKYPTPPIIDLRYAGVLDKLIKHTGATGLLTGRSVWQVAEFSLLRPGIHVVGQFGSEYYHDRFLVERVALPAEELARLDRRLQSVLENANMANASIEKKSHFRAVHYSDGTTPDLSQLKRLASGVGLEYLPGHNVVEFGPRINKQEALHTFVYDALSAWAPSVVLFAGDSPPDLAAFAELDRLRRLGMHTIKVCSSNNEEVQAQADLLVNGPLGTLAMLEKLAEISAR